MQDYLFVYGTLRGGSNSSYGEFIGQDKIPGTLYDLGAFPGYKEGPGKVVGEVIEINPGILHMLDRYEGVEQGLYRRVRVTTDSGREVWVYELLGVPTEGLRKIESGDWFKKWDSSPSG